MNTAKTMVNVSPKMSNRDAIERELEKFVKMFSTKAVQAIVQSRLGDKMQTFSNPRSLSNDWVSGRFSIIKFRVHHFHFNKIRLFDTFNLFTAHNVKPNKIERKWSQ